MFGLSTVCVFICHMSINSPRLPASMNTLRYDLGLGFYR